MNILIIGATSAIAHETAKLFANEGASFFLVARTAEKLAAVKADLLVRNARQVETSLLDLTAVDRYQELIDNAVETFGELDTILIAHGSLGDQQACEQNVTKTLAEFNTNCTSVIALLTIAANYFERKKRGCIAVIGSVAGDRGKKSNYIYGAAKAAVAVFLQGLRNRLSKAGVNVITIKPGFVDTPMTASMPKNALFAQPQRVAQEIHRAIKQSKEVAYTPWFWRPIMFAIKCIPEFVFKRMNL